MTTKNIDSKTRPSKFKFNERGHLIVYLVWRTTTERVELAGVWTSDKPAAIWKKILERQAKECDREEAIEIEERETDHAYSQTILQSEQFKRILAQKRASADTKV